MIAAINREEKTDNVLKEFNVKDAMYVIASVWKDAEKSKVTNAWHTLWPATLFDEDFKGFCVTNEQRMILILQSYAKMSWMKMSKIQRKLISTKC